MLDVHCGDALTVLKTLPEESVQCCVTSPPYDNLRQYGGYEWNFEDIAMQLVRVMCVGGIICWNVADSVINGSETLSSFKQAIFFKESCALRVHDTMIYHKTNFGHPESVRYHQLFEYVFIFSKGTPRCFNPLRDKKNAWAGTGTFGRNSVREANGQMGERKRNIITELGMRGNVWSGKTAGQEGQICQGSKHPAPMPEWLARDLVLSWSNCNDTILDPFGGSGTTGAVALEVGRKAILIELNPDYVKLIHERCASVTPGLQFK